MTGSSTSRSWNSLSASEKSRIEAAFSAHHAADLWLDDSAGDSRVASIAMPALYKAASDPKAFLPADLVGRMATDPGLRADFDQLLHRLAQCQFPRAAAASSGALKQREANGFVLRIKESRADETQVYLLIDLPAHGPARENAPQSLILRTPEGTVLKQALSAPMDGTIRVVLESASELVKALGDPASRIDLL